MARWSHGDAAAGVAQRHEEALPGDVDVKCERPRDGEEVRQASAVEPAGLGAEEGG